MAEDKTRFGDLAATPRGDRNSLGNELDNPGGSPGGLPGSQMMGGRPAGSPGSSPPPGTGLSEPGIETPASKKDWAATEAGEPSRQTGGPIGGSSEGLPGRLESGQPEDTHGTSQPPEGDEHGHEEPR